MALITRISKLFTADLHAVLDSLEEPELLLKQAVREMEEELDRNGQRICWLEHEHEELSERRGQSSASITRLDEELDLCFASGRDELARGLVRRKLETERLTTRLECRIGALGKEIATARANLEENERRLAAMREKAELFAVETRVENSGRDRSGSDSPVGKEEIEVAWLKEKERRGRS
jgi:phage shock protein A